MYQGFDSLSNQGASSLVFDMKPNSEDQRHSVPSVLVSDMDSRADSGDKLALYGSL